MLFQIFEIFLENKVSGWVVILLFHWLFYSSSVGNYFGSLFPFGVDMSNSNRRPKRMQKKQLKKFFQILKGHRSIANNLRSACRNRCKYKKSSPAFIFAWWYTACIEHEKLIESASIRSRIDNSFVQSIFRHLSNFYLNNPLQYEKNSRKYQWFIRQINRHANGFISRCSYGNVSKPEIHLILSTIIIWCGLDEDNFAKAKKISFLFNCMADTTCLHHKFCYSVTLSWCSFLFLLFSIKCVYFVYFAHNTPLAPTVAATIFSSSINRSQSKTCMHRVHTSANRRMKKIE